MKGSWLEGDSLVVEGDLTDDEEYSNRLAQSGNAKVLQGVNPSSLPPHKGLLRIKVSV